MPPFIARKRFRSDSPAPEPSPKRAEKKRPSPRSKESVFQALDAPPAVSQSLSQTEALLGLEDGSSELTDLGSDDDEFEDVLVNKPTFSSPLNARSKRKVNALESGADSDDEDWEDAMGPQGDDEPMPEVSGDIELTLSSAPETSAFSSKTDGKKGSSKIQRQIRIVTHRMHVQFLMYHNLVRNSWIQDKRVQMILLEHLNDGCWRALDQYWRDAGIPDGKSHIVSVGTSQKLKAERTHYSKKWKQVKGGRKGKTRVQVYTNTKGTTGDKPSSSMSKPMNRNPIISSRNQRDWGATSGRLEPNVPNLSAGDPLLRLLEYFAKYWKLKFKITAPSLRKRGYLPPSSLENEIGAWRQDPSNPDLFGERIESLDQFQECARSCQGSSDVGQQLFTALLRGLGFEARIVASLQPVGFASTIAEEGIPKKIEPAMVADNSRATVSGDGTSLSPIDLDHGDSSALSSVISISSDSDSGARPVTKRQQPVEKRRIRGQRLFFPTYWTEAISQLTHKPIAVSPLPTPLVASSSTPDQLQSFYARGATSEKAKQVFAYVVAFSSDGTAKEVTTRYLPNREWPGRTKGYRIPVEKVPIYNERGQVSKVRKFDWFKSVMRPYARRLEDRQPWDQIEDEGDLVSTEPTKAKNTIDQGGKETLQSYKASAEYVLERHLKREEALLSGAQIVRYFITGKGDKEKQEAVYRRRDVVACKTTEAWHKEGRAVIEGEQPLKYVPHRAVTIARKREIEERRREEGEQVKQALYAKAQTDWIIPEPITDGVIPVNQYGSIDIYVPSMVPQGSVHIPLKGTAKICRKLQINFAEACTGFEFGKQRAMPVHTGVVVATENKDLVIDAWKTYEAEKAQKEQDKRKQLVLGMWKKLFSGLRILERLRSEYGENAELPAAQPTTTFARESNQSEWEVFHNRESFEGGFLRDEAGLSGQRAGGFLPPSQEEPAVSHSDSGLTIDHGDQEQERNSSIAGLAYRTPISLHSAIQKPPPEGGEDDEAEIEEKSGVKSHFFAHGSDEETDASPKKSTMMARDSTTGGQSQNRGRGRGRGGRKA